MSTAASPALSVPANRVSAWVVETSAKETEQWLLSLPLTDSAATAQQLYQALYTLNRMDLDAPTRLELMELYRAPVASVSAHLQGHFAHLTLPLRRRQKQLADFLRQLHQEMAHGYKHVVRSQSAARSPWDRQGLLVTAVERAIYYLGQALLRCYDVYMPYPQGVWREVHELYRFGEENDRHNVAGEVGPVDEAPGPTIARSYLEVILLGLCGPYQLPQHECLQVDAFLRHWAGKATITADVEPPGPLGHFLIDLSSDLPAVPFPKDVKVKRLPQLRVVNTTELARAVHRLISRLEKGESPLGLGLGIECIDSACQDMLRRMLRFWGLAARRQFSRRKRRQAYLSVCTGLNAVHFFSSGQRPFVPPQSESSSAQPGDEPDSIPPFNSAADADEGGGPLSTSESYRADGRWQIRDESAGGLALVRYGDVGAPTRVGDVLGIHNPDLNEWRVGVTRWLKSPDSNCVEIGVEMLAPSAKPVAVRAVAASGDASTRFARGLLLPAIEALHQPATLLVGRGIWPPGGDVELMEEEGARRVRALKLAERTGAFEQVVFADLGTSPVG